MPDDSLGLAALRATLESLAQMVSELARHAQYDHDAVTEMRASSVRVDSDIRKLVADVLALQHQTRPDPDEIRRDVEAGAVAEQRLRNIEARMRSHERDHSVAWSKLASLVVWAVAGLVGLVASLASDWLKKKLGI